MSTIHGVQLVVELPTTYNSAALAQQVGDKLAEQIRALRKELEVQVNVSSMER